MKTLPAPSLARHLARTIHPSSLTGLPDEYNTPPMTAREKRRRAKDQREKDRLWRCKERSGYHVRTFGPHNVRVFVASSAVHDSKGAVSVFSTRLMDTTKASAKSRHCEEVRSRGLTVISTAIMPI